MRRVSADGAFDPSKCRQFYVVLSQDYGSSYLFVRTLSRFHVNLHEPDSEEKSFPFAQYFKMNGPLMRSAKNSFVFFLQWSTDDSLDYSIKISMIK